MSHRLDEKQRRREERLAAEAAAEREQRRERWRQRAFWGVGGTLVVGLVSAAFLLGPDDGTGSAPAVDHGSHANPVAMGTAAPDFKVADVVSGEQLTKADLAGKKTLLFFSEGASCQACLVQAADLQKSEALTKAGISLVSVTTDPPEVLTQVAAEYGITTPLLADADRSMSLAYGQLGRGGMGHPEQDGHSFVLLDENGKVLWESAYSEMYVPTPKLLRDMKV